jgi:hypothetical protein
MSIMSLPSAIWYNALLLSTTSTGSRSESVVTWTTRLGIISKTGTYVRLSPSSTDGTPVCESSRHKPICGAPGLYSRAKRSRISCRAKGINSCK